jgi:hypothetical protein
LFNHVIARRPANNISQKQNAHYTQSLLNATVLQRCLAYHDHRNNYRQ